MTTVDTGGPSRTVPRTFYRIVRSDPPTEEDFKSYEALGRPSRDPTSIDEYRGVSVQATETQARNRARALPTLGRFIAEVRISDDSPIRWRRTGSRGHHTLWGDPAELLGYVTGVTAVEEP